jgi:hypothetical protein
MYILFFLQPNSPSSFFSWGFRAKSSKECHIFCARTTSPDYHIFPILVILIVHNSTSIMQKPLVLYYYYYYLFVKRSFLFEVTFIRDVYNGFTKCYSLLETAGIRVPVKNIKDFNTFHTLFSHNECT